MAQSTVQDWARSTWAYLSERWQELVVPSLIVAGASLAATFALIAGFLVFALSFSLVRESALYPALGGLVGFLLFLVAMEALQPLSLGFTRGVMRSMRGEGFPPAELRWGYGRSLSVIALVFLQSSAVLVGLLLCFLPGMVAGVLLGLAVPAMADRDQGAVDALATSLRLTRSRPGEVFAWAAVSIFVVLIVASIPVIGNLLLVPVLTAMNATAYLYLAKEEGSDADGATG